MTRGLIPRGVHARLEFGESAPKRFEQLFQSHAGLLNESTRLSPRRKEMPALWLQFIAVLCVERGSVFVAVECETIAVDRDVLVRVSKVCGRDQAAISAKLPLLRW